MSEKREDQRPENEKLWDKTFEDNEDLDDKGNLSRVKRRKQDSNNSRITTILVVLIIILAAAPIIYWVRHEQAFDHPVRDERVAQSSRPSHRRHSSSHRKRHHSTSKKVKDEQKTSEKQQSTTAESTSSPAASASSAERKYATVQAGQGIYRVAANNGLTVNELARMNNISPNTPLQPGQQLRVK